MSGALAANNRKKTLHRAFSVAALWLALIALVFVYTDPREYSWDYTGGDVSLIWESEAQAAAAQEAASEWVQAQRQVLEEHIAQGIWEESDDYLEEVNRLLPARTDGPGLNLMRGAYEVTINYVSDAPVDLWVAAAGRQAFVQNGSVSLPAAPQGGKSEMTFTLTGSAPGVLLAGDLPEGAQIASVRVHKAGAGVFSRDLAAYALLAGVVLTVLLALSWDEREIGRLRRRDAMILVCAALFASMPSLWYGMLSGRAGHDLFFHLNRIEGIAAGLRAGEFPVRIHSTTLLGYGYAAPEFYPELTMYLPAALRCLGASLATCVRVFQMVVNLAAAWAAYACARRLFDSRRIAVGAAVLYTLSIDRVVNLYTRGSLGESAAMVFLPVVVMGLADVLLGDERRWPVLTLGMLGVFMSHLLSTLFAAGLCALAALLCAGRLLREPRRILAIVKAAALTAVCSLGFLIPFFDYSAQGINTNVTVESWRNVLTLGSLLVTFAGNIAGMDAPDEDFAYHVGLIPGVALLAGCALLLIKGYARGGAPRARASLETDEGREKLANALLALGFAALLCATPFFPWKWLGAMRRPISTIIMQMQFPWRLVGIATPMLAMAAAYGYLREERFAAAGIAALGILSVLLCGYTLTAYLQGNTPYDADFFCDTRIGQYEYTYTGTQKGALEAGLFRAGDEPTQPLEYEREGTTLRVKLDTGTAHSHIEVPLLYYPGYRATVNGQQTELTRGNNNVMRVYNPNRDSVLEIDIRYEEPVSWRVAELASAAGMLLLAALVRGRRWARAA